MMNLKATTKYIIFAGVKAMSAWPNPKEGALANSLECEQPHWPFHVIRALWCIHRYIIWTPVLHPT